MSTVSQHLYPSIEPLQGFRIWWIAALCPVLLASIWLSLSSDYLGPLSGLSGLVLVLLLIASSSTDLSQRRIFNWTTYTAFVWAVAINVMPQSITAYVGSIGLSDCLCGAGSCFVIMLIPYTLARGGAGDVKLATAIGALVGLDSGLLIIAFTYILSAIAILSWTILAKGPFSLLVAMFRSIGSRLFPASVESPSTDEQHLLSKPIPLAGFFAVATLLIVFDIPTLIWSA